MGGQAPDGLREDLPDHLDKGVEETALVLRRLPQSQRGHEPAPPEIGGFVVDAVARAGEFHVVQRTEKGDLLPASAFRPGDEGFFRFFGNLFPKLPLPGGREIGLPFPAFQAGKYLFVCHDLRHDLNSLRAPATTVICIMYHSRRENANFSSEILAKRERSI